MVERMLSGVVERKRRLESLTTREMHSRVRVRDSRRHRHRCCCCCLCQ